MRLIHGVYIYIYMLHSELHNDPPAGCWDRHRHRQEQDTCSLSWSQEEASSCHWGRDPLEDERERERDRDRENLTDNFNETTSMFVLLASSPLSSGTTKFCTVGSCKSAMASRWTSLLSRFWTGSNLSFSLSNFTRSVKGSVGPEQVRIQ